MQYDIPVNASEDELYIIFHEHNFRTRSRIVLEHTIVVLQTNLLLYFLVLCIPNKNAVLM